MSDRTGFQPLSRKEQLAQLLREFPTWGDAALHYKARVEKLERERDEWKQKGHDAFQALIAAGDRARELRNRAETAEAKLREAREAKT